MEPEKLLASKKAVHQQDIQQRRWYNGGMQKNKSPSGSDSSPLKFVGCISHLGGAVLQTRLIDITVESVDTMKKC